MNLIIPKNLYALRKYFGYDKNFLYSGKKENKMILRFKELKDIKINGKMDIFFWTRAFDLKYDDNAKYNLGFDINSIGNLYFEPDCDFDKLFGYNNFGNRFFIDLAMGKNLLSQVPKIRENRKVYFPSDLKKGLDLLNDIIIYQKLI